MVPSVIISHWLPILTFCPVNKLPDLLYIYVTFEGSEFKELYGVRKRIRQIACLRLCFMEEIAMLIKDEFPDAVEVRVELLTGRHVVTIKGRTE